MLSTTQNLLKVSELEQDRFIDELCKDEERGKRLYTTRALQKYFPSVALNKLGKLHAKMVSLEFAPFDGFAFDPEPSDEEKRAAAVHAHDFGSCNDSTCPLRQSLMSSKSSGKRKVEAACHNGAEQPHPLVFLWACRLRAAITPITVLRISYVENQPYSLLLTSCSMCS